MTVLQVKPALSRDCDGRLFGSGTTVDNFDGVFIIFIYAKSKTWFFMASVGTTQQDLPYQLLVCY